MGAAHPPSSGLRPDDDGRLRRPDKCPYSVFWANSIVGQFTFSLHLVVYLIMLLL
jgi:hypothetical protein